ncbi:MAG: RsmE family RNA methyltransferase [Tepidisphaeraceae bacterium]
MIRRLHTSRISPGSVQLGDAEAHHARDVLRLGVGDEVELFDHAGVTAPGRISRCDKKTVLVEVASTSKIANAPAFAVASAIPKGERADWMIEKLSELGVSRLVPLTTARSVVHPSGKSKFDRWTRIAIESAKQSRRIGIMKIEPLTKLEAALSRSMTGVFLSTEPLAPPIVNIQHSTLIDPYFLFVGPEGGWTDAEQVSMKRIGLTPARLTATILRVETAAVAAAAVVACLFAAQSKAPA